jgi:beta-mannanase
MFPRPSRSIQLFSLAAVFLIATLMTSHVDTASAKTKQAKTSTPTVTATPTKTATAPTATPTATGTPTPTPTPAPPSTGIYFGMSPHNIFQNYSDITTFEQDAGKNVSIINWYQSWGPSTDNTTSFQPTLMNTVRSQGAIPMITWLSWDYTLPQTNQPAYSLSNIINGAYDPYITKWAQDSKTWGHPFFLRFDHEMNGPFWPWGEGANGNTSGQYALAWQHVHTIFTQVGASNVTWVWCPNTETSDLRTRPYSEWFPGASYVDWVCMDGYNWGTTQSWSTWESFAQTFSGSYTDIQALAPGKPIMIGEDSSAEQGGSKPAWIADELTVQLPLNFPKIKALLWFNVNMSTSGQTDWRIESSTTAQAAFHTAIASPYYLSNQYSGASQSPIPPPS